METVNNILNALQVALGLGFVIFLHELGHFLLAKWNGVKVEKFSIGFGPTLLGFTRGETEYVLAAVPLGGFVKMLGEGPEEETNKSSDPRAYPNKTVGARMAIISAGVIMNLFLGLACFVYAYKMGLEEIPTRVGSVMAGAPAYLAGLRPGDEIVAMDGRRDLSFNNLTLKIRLSSRGQSIHFDVKRPGRNDLIPMDIEPRREGSADFPGIGIAPTLGLTLAEPPFHAMAGVNGPVSPTETGLKPHDRVIAVGVAGNAGAGEEPTPVEDLQAFFRQLARHQAEPVQLVVERTAKAAKGTTAKVERVNATLPPNRFVDFGFRLKIEPIAAVRNGSPADRAGFRKGDLIVKVDGNADFDPMRLPSLCYDSAGKPLTFEVERAEPGETGAPRTLTLTATPDDTPPWTEFALPDEPLDISGLGLAYPVRTRVQSVVPDSPAAKAGLHAGDVINAMSLPLAQGEKPSKSLIGRLVRWVSVNLFHAKGETPSKAVEFVFDDRTSAWPSVFQNLQFRPLGPVEFRVNNASAMVTITPRPEPSWYHPLRGEQFTTLTRRTPPMSVASALHRGFDDTVENVLSIYAMFRSLAQSRVSPKQLGGPIEIARMAFLQAGLSLTDLVHFLGILSINLAVLNFLPIPPLDGGQMLFLFAEKVRGRPLPESALIAGTYAGLLLVLSLMAFVIFQDVSRYVGALF